ncbi:N-acetyl-D-glucosamine kinase [Diabrotica virgifera virgifera]|uniref:N-acetyl-D-glucosamine kinase n=1 Tax=Diabrotica virgifera virgifera TaxID=50390 RepID=A0A6P7FAU9_DIAVI|nr:N-acetyl-D-glucosamine kinase [Diabrotica virgifera virgifera]
MSRKLIGGIEGGATHSNAIILDSSGNILGQAPGPGTNHHLAGMKEAQKRIAQLVDAAKSKANISLDTKLDALGLSLSGCEQEETNNILKKGLLEDYPNLAEKVLVASDTEGSVAATSKTGGVVCIAGTGSNTLLINPNGSRVQCGGWGNLLGDEGSAWNISHMAIKTCFDELDNFEKSPHPIGAVWDVIRSHFKIKIQADILDYFYANFDKAFIASLAKKISELATRKNDPLAQHIFSKAGSSIAQNITAVVLKADPKLTDREGGIHITCVGSVWHSWELLKPGFLKYLATTNVKELTLMRLDVESGVGAAYLASDKLGLSLDRDYSKNYKILFHYLKEQSACNTSGHNHICDK